MNLFKKEFELRRVLFGLATILRHGGVVDQVR